MRTTGLNLASLRARGRAEAHGTSPPQGLTRRDLFRMAGAAAVVTSLVPSLKASALSSEVTFALTRTRAAFLLNDTERWVIDTARFGGAPVLRTERSPDRVRIALLDAYYPGTDLPADLTCEALKDARGWTLHLRMPLGAFSAEFPLAAWLSGELPASSRVTLDHHVCDLGDQGRLRLNGAAKAQFRPDWTLHLEGVAIAQLQGIASDGLVADSIRMALLQPGDASLLTTPPGRRTLVTLYRRTRSWPLEPKGAAPSGWRLTPTDQPFDIIHLETAVNRQDGVRRALSAEPATRESRMALEAVAGLRDDGDRPGRLNLVSARYAMSFDSHGEQSAFMARFQQEPQWLHADGCSVLLGDSPTSSGLEWARRGGKVTRSSCTPALLGVSAPLSGAVVEPLLFGENSPLVSLAYNTNQEMPGDRVQLPETDLPRRSPSVPIVDEPIFVLPQNLSVTVVRPEDLLVLRFEFVNLRLEAGGGRGARLVRVLSGRPAYIVVHFPPQAVAERAFYETETPGSPGDEPPTAPPVPSRLSGPSRLAFMLPAKTAELPYTLASLLSWTKFDHSLTATAQPPAVRLPIRLGHDDEECECEPLTPSLIVPPRIQSPETYQSAIEAPYRVILSPNKFAGWAHALDPVTREGRTELWHTRMGVQTPGAHVDEGPNYLKTVRAVWTPDFNASAPPPASADTSPFRMSLTSANRNQIVRLSSDFTISNFKPQPIKVERLMLSALGAWLNVRGAWSPPGAFTLEEWRHRAVMGRDTYVRVVEKGYLFPFGHRASLITVTERKFQPSPGGGQAAYLRQRKFVVVREPVKTYPATGQAYGGRQMPLKRVEITTLVTPSLDLPKPIIPAYGESAFWCRVSNNDFLFTLISDDGDGQRVEFTAPLAFIKNDISNDAAKMTQVAQSLANDATVSRRQRSMGGQKLAYAPSDKPGDTSFETVSLTFAAEVPDQSDALGADQPRFFPAMAQAQIRLAAVEQMSGEATPATIRLHQTFLESGFDPGANKGAIFAELVSAAAARFRANMSGGVATPNFGVSGLSRALGPVGGVVDDLVNGTFDPTKFFNDQAKILGGIVLGEIIKLLNLTGGNAKDERVPQLTSRVVYPAGADGKENKNAVPLGVETKLTWRPDVKNDPLNIFVASTDTSLYIMARLFADFDGNPPRYEVIGELKNFKVDLIAPVTSFLVLTFKEVTFSARDGEKPSVDPKIDKVEFKGPLQFVQTLQNFLKSGGGGGGGKSPFSLDVTPSGVKAGLSLSLPSVQIGILAIQNMMLSMHLNLPFSGEPVRLRFAFCERENPFILTVSMFGGGGFFAVELGLDGIALMEASFEFGGNMSLDIGVASGGVYLMAGIYYKMEGDDAQLTGYLKCGGSLEVLGIITISAEFYMGLTYDIPNDKVWGQATLTVKVEVLFFSASVDLHVERKFKGAAGDPTFADLTTRDDWETYAEAFA